MEDLYRSPLYVSFTFFTFAHIVHVLENLLHKFSDPFATSNACFAKAASFNRLFVSVYLESLP